MMKRNILLALAALLLVGYVLAMAVVVPRESEVPRCKQVDIRLLDARHRAYITPEEVRAYLYKYCGSPVGKVADSLSLERMEQVLEEHPLLRNAECYTRPDGSLCVRVTQREPILRVMADGGETYFVDSDRKRMPVMSTTAAYVPIVTGRVSERMASEELYDFVEWLEGDRYWQPQIVQINVRNPHYIELVPRVGNGVIIMGELTNVEQKLDKLKRLYTDGFSQFGWEDAYREVDLRFNGQVVCRK